MRPVRAESMQCEAVIGAVADGVGSCAFSEYGSQTAVKAVLDYMETHIGTISPDSVLLELRNAYQFALDQIEEKADEQYWSLPSLDTTLTTAVYLEDGSLFFGHSGDGGIVALYTDGSYEMITSRQKGEESNSVLPLRTKKWQFAKARKSVAAFAMMTDGVLDCWVGMELFHNRVFFPFFRPLLAKLRTTDVENQQCKSELNSYLLSAAFRKKVTDDITFASVQNPELAAQLPEISFDEEAWNQETARISEKTEKRLAEGAKAIQSQVNQSPMTPKTGFPGGLSKPTSPATHSTQANPETPFTKTEGLSGQRNEQSLATRSQKTGGLFAGMEWKSFSFSNSSQGKVVKKNFVQDSSKPDNTHKTDSEHPD